MTEPDPAVGVVVVTRNRQASLLRTLRRLRSLPEQPAIVVVDNASTDATAAAVRTAHPEVRLLQLDHNAGAAGRTAGLQALETETVAFSDDDSWWAPGSLAHAARVLALNPGVGLIAARILVGQGGRLDPTCASMADSPLPRAADLPGPAVLGFVACGAVVRRRAYLEVGGFEPRLGLGSEEYLLALDLAAAGWSLTYIDAIVAHHHPHPGAAGRSDRRAQELRNLIWIAWLRRPVTRAMAHSGSFAAACLRERRGHTLLQAARGLPWVLRERRSLPPAVERAARQLSAP
jgi:GT2 family glycosyltransferase